MKLMKPLMLATMLISLPLTSCQTNNSSGSLDTSAHQEKSVELASAEWCRGQKPLTLDKLGVTPADYKAAPEWVRKYIEANDAQWAKPCKGQHQ